MIHLPSARACPELFDLASSNCFVELLQYKEGIDQTGVSAGIRSDIHGLAKRFGCLLPLPFGKIRVSQVEICRSVMWIACYPLLKN